MKKLALISTGVSVVEPIMSIIREFDPHLEVFNIVDDSIVNCIATNSNEISPLVKRKLATYAALAEENGADAMLVTCSSISEVVDFIAPFVRIPVFKIDQPMARHAVKVGRTIGIAATLVTTLEPTKRLILSEAEKVQKEVRLEESLCNGAFESLVSGDVESHDTLVRNAVLELLQKCDVVVLAQASMARAVSKIEVGEDRVLTSPRLGVQRVVNYLRE